MLRKQTCQLGFGGHADAASRAFQIQHVSSSKEIDPTSGYLQTEANLVRECFRAATRASAMGDVCAKQDIPTRVSVRARGVIFGGDLGAAGGGACPTTSSFDLGGHRAHR